MSSGSSTVPAAPPPRREEGSSALNASQLEALATLATVLKPKLDRLPPQERLTATSTDALAASASPGGRFTPEDLFDFAETTFYVPETSRPIHLEPVQRVILTCMFDLRLAAHWGVPGGFQNYIYSTVKKSGKTTIAALIARWICERWGRSNEVYTVANDLDQSRGLVYDKILKSLELDPRYDKHKGEISGVWDIVRREATHVPTRSVLRALSGDYKGQAGMNPTATFWSELWGYTLEGSTRLWDELTPVPTRPRSIRYVETYAGFEGESLLLIEQFEIGTLEKRGAHQITYDELLSLGLEWPGPEREGLPLYVNPLTRQFTYWDTGEAARRMPWQTPGYYSSQAASLRPNAFDRLHSNMWVSSTSTFLPIEWWDACRARPEEVSTQDDVDPTLSHISPHVTSPPVIVAADASVSGDCTGIVAITRNSLRPNDGLLLRRAQSWAPPEGGTINYGLTLEPTLRQWITGHIHPLAESCDRHSRVEQLGPCIPTTPMNVVQLCYDMYQLHDMMSRFRDEGIVWVYSFSQGGDRMVADHQLYTLIKDRRLLHWGDQAVRDHMSHAAAKISKDSNTKMRIVKKSTAGKIDLVVAASMASHECLRLAL